MHPKLQAALNAFEQKKFDVALKLADEIIELDPGISYSHRFKGETLFQMNEYSECISHFRKAEEIGGEGTEDCFFWRAMAYANMGEPHLAIVLLQEYRERSDAIDSLVLKCDSFLHQLGAT